MLTFDEVAHVYYWNGKRVPGVTTILQALHSFDGVPADILKAAQERGTAVHLACEYLDKDILDEDSVDPAIADYVNGWRLFNIEAAPTWTHIEAQSFHKVMRYAGTVDRVGIIAGEEWVIDIKTSIQSHAVWGLQTSAYAQALEKPNARRGTVQLRKDGTYRLIEWKDKQDWATFLSLITINNFIEKNK